MKKNIQLICSICLLPYSVPNSKGKMMRDWNIDSAICTNCGVPRNISLTIWGELRVCRICRRIKPLFSFHNGSGMICEYCHDKRGTKERVKRGTNKRKLYNKENGFSYLRKRSEVAAVGG